MKAITRYRKLRRMLPFPTAGAAIAAAISYADGCSAISTILHASLSWVYVALYYAEKTGYLTASDTNTILSMILMGGM